MMRGGTSKGTYFMASDLPKDGTAKKQRVPLGSRQTKSATRPPPIQKIFYQVLESMGPNHLSGVGGDLLQWHMVEGIYVGIRCTKYRKFCLGTFGFTGSEK